MQSETDILVVGAGPVGLLAACELRRHGVGCRVIDKLAAPAGWVKALGVSQRTLEVFDDLGVVGEALDAGLILRRQRVFVNRAPAADTDPVFPDDAPYRYPLLLPQPATERILTGLLVRSGGRIERGTELVSFAEDGDGVRATLAGPDGSREVRCRYLVGCDGAHSAVRRGLGLPFEGGRFPAEFLLADVAIDWEYEHAAAGLFLETRDGHLDNLLVCIPYRDPADPTARRYRVSTMARSVSETGWDESAEEPAGTAPGPTLGRVQELLARFVPVPATADGLRWSSAFRISHRIVPRYRVGRAFLAGDAAHVHPPTGGQGMNTGLQDAYNLAWKLALDVKGLAAPGLLDSYDAERRPVGVAVVERATRRSVNIGDRSGPDADAARADSQLDMTYRGGGWVADAAGGGTAPGAPAGDRAPDVGGLVRDGATFPVRLFDLLRGPHHTLLLSGDDRGTAVEVGRRFGDRVRAYRVVGPGESVRGEPAVVDADGHFRRVYGTATYLVRPDGYVGCRTDSPGAGGLEAYFGKVFGPG